MDGPFQVGAASHIGAWLLAALVAGYAAMTARFTSRAFRAGLEDRWSAFVATMTMIALGVLLFTWGPQLMPAPFSFWSLAVAAAGIFITLTYTLGRIQDRIQAFQEQFGGRLNQMLERSLPEDRLAELRRLRASWEEKKEERRKTPHLLMALFLAFYGVIGFLVLRGIWQTMYGGSAGDMAGEGVANLYAASHAAAGTYLTAGHHFSLFLLMGLVLLLAPNEMMRLRFPETGYPFKAIILANLRDKEAGLFGAHYYIAAALPLAALWLTRDAADWPIMIPAVVAIIAVTVFADAASALVGVRFGRRRLWTNPDKSVEGTLGGCAVAFAVAVPFVGPVVAAVSAGVFGLLDILGPRPIPVSDNLLNPLGLAVAYTLCAGAIDPMIPFY